ncbi:MAG: hypothetical protein K6G47_08180 [Clostridia bacterium]|nr:hypothetical protein [Clostridia bacterium]
MSENNINSNWQCTCGQINNGNFCCSCGRQKVLYTAPPVQPQMQYQQPQYQQPQPQPSVAVEPKHGSKIKRLDFIISLIGTIGVFLSNAPGMFISLMLAVAGPIALMLGARNEDEYTTGFLVAGLESIIYLMLILALIFNIVSYKKSKNRPFKKYKPFRILIAIFIMLSSVGSLVSVIWLYSFLDYPILLAIPVIAIPLGIATLIVNIIDACSNKDQINA